MALGSPPKETTALLGDVAEDRLDESSALEESIDRLNQRWDSPDFVEQNAIGAHSPKEVVFACAAIMLAVSAAVVFLCRNLPASIQEMSASYESSNIVGGDRDVHGCIPSAGYSWCPDTKKCFRPWEESCPSFVSLPTGVIGNDRDENGCIPSAGYSWCQDTKTCVRPWEEICPSLVENPSGDFGNDRDENGCIPSAGYSWCPDTKACVRLWEAECLSLVTDPSGLVGDDRDGHGCIPSAGYSWCPDTKTCIRQWEEDCPSLVGGS